MGSKLTCSQVSIIHRLGLQLDSLGVDCGLNWYGKFSGVLVFKDFTNSL
jgi:hypothetical protein